MIILERSCDRMLKYVHTTNSRLQPEEYIHAHTRSQVVILRRIYLGIPLSCLTLFLPAEWAPESFEMTSVKTPCLVTQANVEPLSHWHLELCGQEMWESKRERETECSGREKGGREREREEGKERDILPPLENCANIQSAMWTKLGSSDCMKRVINSTDEGSESKRALWYSAAGHMTYLTNIIAHIGSIWLTIDGQMTYDPCTVVLHLRVWTTG